jgi:hypothetical protein
MSGAIHPLPQYAFMAWCLVKKKHRDNFTFFFTYYLRTDSVYVKLSDENSQFRTVAMFIPVDL